MSIECFKDDKVQVVFYNLRAKECINIIPEDYSVTSVIIVLEGSIRFHSAHENYDLKIHDSIMLTDIEHSMYAEAISATKLLALSTEANQDPQEDGALNAMLVDVEDKDVYTLGHSRRVSLYAKRLALAYESTYNVVSLSAAACMHDIGKINTPIEILQKPSSLTAEEFEIIKQHPLDSYTILMNKLEERVAIAALRHHERLDGSGYPYGLKGDQIGMDARIIAIADVFDAMTCKRTYNEPKSAMDVITYLEENTQKYDERIIAVLRRKVENGEIEDITSAFLNG